MLKRNEIVLSQQAPTDSGAVPVTRKRTEIKTENSGDRNGIDNETGAFGLKDLGYIIDAGKKIHKIKMIATTL